MCEGLWLLFGLVYVIRCCWLCVRAMIHVSRQGSREEVLCTHGLLLPPASKSTDRIEIGPEFLTFESVGVKAATVLSDTISKMEGKNSL